MPLDEQYWNDERKELYNILFPLVYAAAVDAAEGSLRSLIADVGVGVDWGLVNESARRWASRYTYDLVSRVTDTTRRFLQQSVADWITSGAPLPDLIKTITPMFGKVRAEMIAATEVTRAYAESNNTVWRESGVVDGKRWMTVEDERVCKICGPLADKTVNLDNWFSPLVKDPPAHVRCRCYTQPVVNLEKARAHHHQGIGRTGSEAGGDGRGRGDGAIQGDGGSSTLRPQPGAEISPEAEGEHIQAHGNAGA